MSKGIAGGIRIPSGESSNGSGQYLHNANDEAGNRVVQTSQSD
jgi:hypothetical protein